MSDTVDPLRDSRRDPLDVFEIDPAGNVVAEVVIRHAFLSDFRISDFDKSSSDPGTLAFVVVPDGLEVQSASGLAVAPPLQLFTQDDFTFTMSEGLEGLSVAAVRGLHVSVPKVPSPHPDNRQHFQPGVPQLDVIRVDVYGSDFSGIQRLVDEAAAGNPAQVTGTLTIDDQRNNPLFEVDFDSLVPVAWTPFPTVVTTVSSMRALTLEFSSIDFRQ